MLVHRTDSQGIRAGSAGRLAPALIRINPVNRRRFPPAPPVAEAAGPSGAAGQAIERAGDAAVEGLGRPVELVVAGAEGRHEADHAALPAQAEDQAVLEAALVDRLAKREEGRLAAAVLDELDAVNEPAPPHVA